MNTSFIIISIIFVPIIGAFLLPLLGKINKTLRNFSALALTMYSFVASAVLANSVFAGTSVSMNIPLPLGINFAFLADGLAVFVALVSSFVSSVVVLYSFDYIDHYEEQNEYYLMVVLFLGAMMGIVYSANLIFLYLFWEITALVSWRLIGFFRSRYDVVKADKAFLVTAFGALAMLVAFIQIYQQTGSFDLAVIGESFKTQPISNWAMILILAGIFSKSATLPFQTWLPDAGVAPSPVTALLHAAVLVKIGVYVFARLFDVSFPMPTEWHTYVAAIAAASALVAAGAALIDTNLKRIIAYSTISQIGFIFLGLASGTAIGMAGGVLYILMHGLAKAGLFLCAGIIEQNTKTKDITKMGGLIKSMPATALAFLFCSFSVMGIPPLGGFFCKYMVINGAFLAGQTYIAFTFVFGAVLTILYLFRTFNRVFLGEPQGELKREGSVLMVSSVVLLALLSILGGIFISYPADVVEGFVKSFITL